MNLVEALATAIARQEGYLVEDRRTGKLIPNPKKVSPVLANNPGALIVPGLPQEKGITKFPTITSGWVALQNQIKTNIYGRNSNDPYYRRRSHPMNLYEFFAGQRDAKGTVLPGGYPGYAPKGHGKNDPKAYAENVAAWTGLDPKEKLINLIR